MGEAWDFVTKLPKLLDEWGSYSYALLSVLFLLGAAALLYVRSSRARGRPKALRPIGQVLVALSAAGLVLKLWGAADDRIARERWVKQHQARPGERRLVISNPFPMNTGPAVPDTHAAHALVTMLSSVLGEDFPASLPMPIIVPVDFGDSVSPWRQRGVGQDTFSEIVARLNALQIVWGDLDAQQNVARAFIGFRADLLDTWAPLNDLPLSADPRRDVRFGAAYYRLLGGVALGVALDTWRAAEASSAEERKRLFQLAHQQITDVQSLVLAYRTDKVLERTVYGPRVREILQRCRDEAGVTP